jgi:CDGSH-type Zn-finger protein/uncharacterized Fe-S cluster protein YjdI
MKKEYSNTNLTVTWEPDKCIHSENCWRGLGKVFKPRSKPWIDVEGANNQTIMEQIDKCPSGALGYYKNNEGPKKDTLIELNAKAIVAKKEPAKVELTKGKTYAWCACGRSNSQPFCDGTHKKTDLNPLVFKPKDNGGSWLCQCKQTSNPPYCDGTHNKLLS